MFQIMENQINLPFNGTEKTLKQLDNAVTALNDLMLNTDIPTKTVTQIVRFKKVLIGFLNAYKTVEKIDENAEKIENGEY